MMRYVDEFRDPFVCQRLLESIRRTSHTPWRIMEVCGGQTHGLLQQGIDRALDGHVEILHGPGCPVCVTPAEAIDYAIELSLRSRTLLTTFGDMLRVPGTKHSLRDAQGQGARVKMVYSPLDAVQLAKSDPSQDIVFFAVGFETTAPATALAVLQAAQAGLTNFFLLVRHVRVLPGLRAIFAEDQHHVQGILAAGHVCAVDGFADYESFVRRFRVPVVVTGFEPADLLAGIDQAVTLLEQGESRVVNQYTRHVQPDGNIHARQIIDRVYEPCDCTWRGMGQVAEGGMTLRREWSGFCAERHWGRADAGTSEAIGGHHDCPSGEVLKGRLKPCDCRHFGSACRPETPLGAPMVSSEGACAAYYRRRVQGASVDESW